MLAELCGSGRVQVVVVEQALGLQILWSDVSSVGGRCSSTDRIFAGNLFNSIVWHLLGKGVGSSVLVGIIDEELLGIGIAYVL